MENEERKDEKYLTCHFNGGDLKEILPILEKHFSFTLFEIQGILVCNIKMMKEVDNLIMSECFS